MRTEINLFFSQGKIGDEPLESAESFVSYVFRHFQDSAEATDQEEAGT